MTAGKNFRRDGVSDWDILINTQWDDSASETTDEDKSRRNLVRRILRKAHTMLAPPDYYVDPTNEPSDPNRQASDAEYLQICAELIPDRQSTDSFATEDISQQAS